MGAPPALNVEISKILQVECVAPPKENQDMREREGPKNQETWSQLLLWLEQSCSETLLATYRVGVKGAHVGPIIGLYCFLLCSAELPSDNLKEVWQGGRGRSILLSQPPVVDAAPTHRPCSCSRCSACASPISCNFPLAPAACFCLFKLKAGDSRSTSGAEIWTEEAAIHTPSLMLAICEVALDKLSSFLVHTTIALPDHSTGCFLIKPFQMPA